VCFSFSSWLRMSFLIFSMSAALQDSWHVSFALTASFSTLYCENSVIISWNSASEILLSANALERSQSTVLRFTMASVTISWCFLIFESSFLLVIISPEEIKAKQPPTPLSGIVASSPMTDRAKPKLALENAAERTLEPTALQLTTFFVRLYFLWTTR